MVVAVVRFLRKHCDAESKGSKQRVNALFCKHAVNVSASYLEQNVNIIANYLVQNIMETDFLCLCKMCIVKAYFSVDLT